MRNRLSSTFALSAFAERCLEISLTFSPKALLFSESVVTSSMCFMNVSTVCATTVCSDVCCAEMRMVLLSFSEVF